nr:retrovirus-related Pol polyprotein from transposon TNT 1-94 [Tanacetum cinerariifolium]
PRPVPTGKPKVFAPVPAGRQNRPFPVPTDRGYSPSVSSGWSKKKVYTGYPRIIVDLIHLHTDDNVADLLTKDFDGPRASVPSGVASVPTGSFVPTGCSLPAGYIDLLSIPTLHSNHQPAQTLNPISTSSMAALRYKDEHNKVGYLLKPIGSDDYHQIIDFLRASHIRAKHEWAKSQTTEYAGVLEAVNALDKKAPKGTVIKTPKVRVGKEANTGVVEAPDSLRTKISSRTTYSATHLIKDCDFYEKQMANKTIGIRVGSVHSRNKVNHQTQFVLQAVLFRTGKVNIPSVRPYPVPTGKPKVFASVPTGRQNMPFPVPTDRGYSPSVVLGNHTEKVYTGYPRTIVDLIHLHTDDNVADLLTKAFDGPRHIKSTHVATVVPKSVAGLRFPEDSSMLLPFGVQCCWFEFKYVVPTGRVIVPTGRYVVPTGRVIIATGRYVVPTGRVIVPTGRYVVPTGRVIIATGSQFTLFKALAKKEAPFGVTDDMVISTIIMMMVVEAKALYVSLFPDQISPLESDLGRSNSLPQSLKKLSKDFLVEVEEFKVLSLTLLKTQGQRMPQEAGIKGSSLASVLDDDSVSYSPPRGLNHHHIERALFPLSVQQKKTVIEETYHVTFDESIEAISSSMKTPMVLLNNLGPDIVGKPVNETLYRGMIRYLKGTPSLGLYYPKFSRFDLKGYSDYANCNMDRKITSDLSGVSSCDEASNWLEHLLAGSITTWEDLTTRFLAQFFPSGRTEKLHNDILMFQQHHGESLSEAWTRPNPQPQALGTTFEARVRDYMAAHTERMENFKNAIFKQREEINDKMTKMFGLLKELITSRTPEKVLIREEAKFPVTKNINYISLVSGEEERSDKINVATVNDIEKPTRTEMVMQANEAEKDNKARKEEMTVVPSSQTV